MGDNKDIKPSTNLFGNSAKMSGTSGNGSSSGSLPPLFDGSFQFSTWKELLENYFVLNDTPAAKQKAMALSRISPAVYEALKARLNGESPGDEKKTYEIVMSELKSIYEVKPSVMAARYELITRVQKPGETPKEFMKELKILAARCEFKSITDVADAFVTLTYLKGLEEVNLKVALLRDEELTSSKAEVTTNLYCSSVKTAADMSLRGHASINIVDKKVKRQKGYGVTCHRCGESGHIAANCEASKPKRFKGNNRSYGKKAHEIADRYASDSDDEFNGLAINSINVVEPPRVVTVKVNEKPIEFELDTGASISIISEKTWRKLQRPELVEKCGKVVSYSAVVPMLGKCNANVKLGNVKAKMKLSVSKGTQRDLLGRDLISLLRMDMGPHYPKAMRSELPKSRMEKGRCKSRYKPKSGKLC